MHFIEFGQLAQLPRKQLSWFHLGFTALGCHCCGLLCSNAVRTSLCKSQICLWRLALIQQVTDRRDVVFRERDLPGSFPGHGQVVGHSKSNEVQETTKIPGKFLDLPQKCS